jgi:predicted enzyme related to lactoylglutathione lyase
MAAIHFAHINLIAKDWRSLARFYVEVFDCKPVYPERDLSGEWIEKLTNIPEAEIQGIHVKLPGYDEGPTLEIFSYNKSEHKQSKRINEQGYAHIAFRVDDVREALDRVFSQGGSAYGERVKKEIEGLGIIEVVYVKDPEGNIVEIQKWSDY